MLDAILQKRFEDALATRNLKGLAEQMTSEGLTQVAIYHHFESFLQYLGDAKRESDEEDEDELRDCLDCVVGFCSPMSKWFDHYLSNEEIEEYRKSIG